MDCLICHEREADKTGSHVIPHFIIESMVTGPDGGRDKEESFMISGNGSDYYFGRSVQPEDIEVTLGRNISDEDIEENQHHYIQDYIFCTSCETKLSYFEALYSRKVVQATSRHEELDIEQMQIAYFFWLSIILRCSVTKYTGFELDSRIEEDLRSTLIEILGNSVEATYRNCLEKEMFYNMILISHFSAIKKKENFGLLHPFLKSPYLLIINQNTVIFDFNTDMDIQQIIFDLKVDLDISFCDKFGNCYLEEEGRKHIIAYVTNFYVAYFSAKVMSKFKRAYFLKHSQNPTEERIEAFMAQLTQEAGVGLADRYHPARIQYLIQRYIS